MDQLTELRTRAAEIADLEKASYVLDWDEETHMPAGGSDERLHQKTALEGVVAERKASARLAELVELLAPREAELDPGSDDASLIRVMRRTVERARRVPLDLQGRLVEEQARGYQQWLAARDAEDFELVRGQLERVVGLRREVGSAIGLSDDPYDALLDEWEPGMTTADIDPVFAALKDELVALLDRLGPDPEGGGILAGRIPAGPQQRFTGWLLEQWGFEAGSWRLDPGVHPSLYPLGLGDVRLTSCFVDRDLSGFFGCLHEFGHGLYRAQIAPSLSRTPLREPASSGLDESQSRLFENLLGRRLSTWRFAYPRLRQEVGESLDDVPLGRFYRAVNTVRPSPIRTTADEVTYGLHIVLRYELEREMIAGTVAVADLPEAFASRLTQYLGIQPAGIDDGVLQDPHWFDLGFGYFPTITLGDILSVQIWEHAERELGPLDPQLERGEAEPLRRWLADNVHAHGGKFTTPETIELATGGPLDAGPYVAYLRQKYTDLQEMTT